VRVAERDEQLLDAFEAERDPLPAVQLGADLGVGERVVQS
jgi:hypothetical protein